MGACTPTKNNSGIKKDKDIMDQLHKLNLKPLIQKLRSKYTRYRKEHLQISDNKDITVIQEQIRNIYMGLIKQKIMQVNQNKITMKQCKIEISQQILEVQIFILKHIQNMKIQDKSVDVIKQFFQLTGDFLITLSKFLKTIYPRGENVQAGELAKLFKQFDSTEEYEFDILKNAGFVFSSPDQFDITNTIKLFLNEIITELDKKFSDFQKMIQNLDPHFKIGRKLSENTSKYLKLDTGTIQIKSTQVARVLTKWMQDLTDTLGKSDQKITAKNEYNFYKKSAQHKQIEFSKCEEESFRKILGQDLISILQYSRDQYNNSTKIRKSKFRKFNMNLMRIFNEVEHNQSQVSRQQMQVIKYSSFNNSFIMWMVEQQLIQSIKCLVEVGSQHQEFRGTLNLLKFKINDLMRCQVLGTKKKIIDLFDKFKKLEQAGQIQIVKIKNRFQTPMSDAMIFFKMPDSFIICECQLILSEQNKGEDAKKTKNIETLNHFIYELERSPFGVLGQIAVFLTAKSQSVASYCDTIRLSLRDTQKIDTCFKQHKQVYSEQRKKYKQQKSPILCCKCVKFYPKFSNKIKVHNCYKCMIVLCNGCMGQKFKITEQMIKKSLTKRLQLSKTEIKKTKPYRQKPEQYDKGLQQVTADTIMGQFQKNAVTEVKYIKESFKQNKNIRIKVQAIIEYINSKEDYIKLYIQKGLKVNFVVVTWRGGSARFKCYRYDHDQRNIVNVFEPIQKYQNHQFIQFNDFDLFLEFKSGGITKFGQKNTRDDGYELKCKSNLQRGFYIFQAQNKQQMARVFDQISEEDRDKYLLISLQLCNQLFLIIDFDQSIKRSSKIDKLKQRLKQIEKSGEFRKNIKLSSLDITDQSFNNFSTHIQWIKMIKNLNLSDNNISNIDIPLQMCPRLEKLNINNNLFEQLIFKKSVPNLTDLDASDNNIKRIVNLFNIRKVESLNLRSNQIKSLTKFRDNNKIFARQFQSLSEKAICWPGIFNFFNKQQEQSFQKVQLKDESNSNNRNSQKQTNQSKQSGYTYLRLLNLANNKFQSMNQFAKGYFPNLTYLNLNDNLIDKVPSMLLDRLEELHLANNCIDSLEQFSKGDNSSISTLIIRNNKLNNFPKFSMPNLQRIDISDNIIQNISEFTAGDYFQNLSHLFLGQLRVQNIPKLTKSIRVFGLQNSQINDKDLQKIISQIQLPRLRELHLTRNKITRLPKIESLIYLRTIFLDQNPIKDVSQLLRQIQVSAQQQRLQKKQDKQKLTKQKEQDHPLHQQKKIKQYKNIERLWMSLQLQSIQKFKTIKQKIEKYLQYTRIVCTRYDSVFGGMVDKPKRKFQLFQRQKLQYKQLLAKRVYLLNIFQNQSVINSRYELEETSGLYGLEHQWYNIDMDEFVKYDWNQIQSIDLRGSSFNDKKWRIFVENAELFPNLQEIHIYDNKIQTLNNGDLESFKALVKIDFYQNGWTNPLSLTSKLYLKSFRQTHPDIQVYYEQ